MAKGGSVVVEASTIEDRDGTLRNAMELWSCHVGAVQYNAWQSGYFQMLRDHNLIDEGAPDGETQSARQTRIREMHTEIEREIHGPDHKRQALRSAVRVVAEPDEAGVSEGPQREPVGRESSGATAGGPPDRAAEEEEEGYVL